MDINCSLNMLNKLYISFDCLFIMDIHNSSFLCVFLSDGIHNKKAELAAFRPFLAKG